MVNSQRSYYNFRVLRHIEGGNASYAVHMVHYRNNKIEGYSAEPMRLERESCGELQLVLSQIAMAFAKPILMDVNGKLMETSNVKA